MYNLRNLEDRGV